MKLKIKELPAKAQPMVVWVLRVLVGAVFIFSGIVKAIDPWGGLYKISEYCSSVQLDVTHETAVVLAFLLAGFEFTSGVLLLVGAFRRTMVWLLSAFMLVMTAITVWIYFASPVADCGCFGDAIILSNGATLLKNIVLCVFVAVLLKYNHKVVGVYHFHLQWLVLVSSVAYAVVLGLVGYFIQPIIDFRPFKVGTNLAEMVDNAEAPLFVYKKGDETKTFAVDNLPGEDWIFVERIEQTKASNELAIFDDGDDVTEDVLEMSERGGLLMLIVTHPDRYGISRSRMANRLNDYMRQNDGAMVALIPEADDSIKQKWIDDVEARYEVYAAEDTDMKAFARGEAALVYVKDKVVKWKYNVYALSPEIRTIIDKKSPDAISNIRALESKHLFMKLTVAYLIALFVIFACASMPITLYKKLSRKKVAKSSIDE